MDNNKLVSLKDLPATKDDVNIVCYEVLINELRLNGIYENEDLMSCGMAKFEGKQPDSFYNNERIYRTKPVIISEAEYQELKQIEINIEEFVTKLNNLHEENYTIKKDNLKLQSECERLKAENKKLKELLERANDLISCIDKSCDCYDNYDIDPVQWLFDYSELKGD